MPHKDPDKRREYNRIKKLEYYHKNPKKFNAERKRYKKSVVTKEKQKEYSARYYVKKREARIKFSQEYRIKNRALVNERARLKRRFDDPTMPINDVVKLFIDGTLSTKQFTDRVDEIIANINNEINKGINDGKTN